MIELPRQEPCEICETLAGRTNVPVVAESELTITVVTPVQFEVGQCCVVTRRHAGTLLDLTDEEGAAVIKAARDVAHALLTTYKPLGILTFQNNGVYSGQEVPHYHFHVVPRQLGSDWESALPSCTSFRTPVVRQGRFMTHRPMVRDANGPESTQRPSMRSPRSFERTYLSRLVDGDLWPTEAESRSS